ncbi:Protein kinase domain-containing protein [Actinobaculum suis]|uniref:Protein kinase domain-containing protein n=1 Tax=Actinobaculum suis TaxID=1657 RepID=A0A1G7B550_9ACTO|nr:Protein kinase domain-containing protein [Actinobaculum suis]
MRSIGQGGMSTVYEAIDGGGTRVALKLLHPAAVADPAGRTRLRREVDMLQRVKGPYVAEVLDAEIEDETAFIVTELVDGPTLAEDVRTDGPYDRHDLVELATRLGHAVHSVHEIGVLHRDLKPSNVMISSAGPILIDFGIAQTGSDTRLTQRGSITHTPGYLDPRVLMGAQPDEAADFWALAAVIAFAATGHDPYGGDSAPVIMRKVLDGEADLSGVPPAIAQAFAQALAGRLEERLPYAQLIECLRDPQAWQGAPVPPPAPNQATRAYMPPIAGDGEGSTGAAGQKPGLGRAAGMGAAAGLGAAAGAALGASIASGAEIGARAGDGAGGGLGAGAGGVAGAGTGDVAGAGVGTNDPDATRPYSGIPHDSGLALASSELSEAGSGYHGAAQAGLQPGSTAPDSDRTQVLSAGLDTDRTQVLSAGPVFNAGADSDRTQVLSAGPNSDRTQMLPGGQESAMHAGTPTLAYPVAPKYQLAPEYFEADNEYEPAAGYASPAATPAPAVAPQAASYPQAAPPVDIAVPVANNNGAPGWPGGEPPAGAGPNVGVPGGQAQPGGAWQGEQVGAWQGEQGAGWPGAPAGMAAPAPTPRWARPAANAPFLTLLAGCILVQLLWRWPIPTGLAYVLGCFVLAALAITRGALQKRRFAAGGTHSGDLLWAVGRFPLACAQALVNGIGMVITGAAGGLALAWVLYLFELVTVDFAFLAGATGAVLMSWFGPGGAWTREGSRIVFSVLAPSPGYRRFWGVLLALGAVALLAVTLSTPTKWAPLPDAPFFIPGAPDVDLESIFG